MKMAKRICQRRRDVLFLIAGTERTNYGHETLHIGNQTFKQWVLSRDSYDLSRFHFLGLIPTSDLAALYNLSDLHVYLTVPYVLSWSLVQAMASGCPILGSATAPVQEVIDDGVQGRLVDFYDVEGLTEHALELLDHPEEARRLGDAARQRVLERYELKKCVNQLVEYFESFQKAR
jgi:glycosyltransferase involved in cell wall biosynthesis